LVRKIYIIIFLLIGLISGIYNNTYCQIIDNYGIRFGAGLSNQYWDYKNFPNLSGWKDNKLGIDIHFAAEKKLGKHISIRPELGYMQKGFANNITYTTAEEGDIKVDNNNVVLHNLSSNIGVKYSPFSNNIKPYFIAGIRCNYLLDYKDIIIESQNVKYGIYADILSDFNKFATSGLLSVGVEYNNRIYIELEYNPAISKSLNDNSLEITDRCFSLTIGLKINNFF